MPEKPVLGSPTDDHLQKALQTLVGVVARLRGPEGCPWDKQQTQKSLTPYILEEAYELTEAIEQCDPAQIQDELGDYLFQVVLQAQVAADEGQFTFADVVIGLSEKLVRRHPHVFTDSADSKKDEKNPPDIEEIWRVWNKIKLSEKKSSSLFSAPKTLPALQAAAKIGRKTQTYGFDWTLVQDVLSKVKEELLEVEETLAQTDKARQQEELGDLLFSVAQLARHLDLDPETCLRLGNQKFITRFEKMLELQGINVEEFAKLSEQQKESLWSSVK